MKIVLDTSAYVEFKRNNQDAVDLITSAELVLFSPVVLAELLFGFRNGTRFQQNVKELKAFLEHDAVEFIKIGQTTADRFSRIALELKQQGTPIPTNDIWIAAQALEHGAELISSDRHFQNVRGLALTMFST